MEGPLDKQAVQRLLKELKRVDSRRMLFGAGERDYTLHFSCARCSSPEKRSAGDRFVANAGFLLGLGAKPLGSGEQAHTFCCKLAPLRIEGAIGRGGFAIESRQKGALARDQGPYSLPAGLNRAAQTMISSRAHSSPVARFARMNSLRRGRVNATGIGEESLGRPPSRQSPRNPFPTSTLEYKSP
jgi:hypothetical protein